MSARRAFWEMCVVFVLLGVFVLSAYMAVTDNLSGRSLGLAYEEVEVLEPLPVVPHITDPGNENLAAFVARNLERVGPALSEPVVDSDTKVGMIDVLSLEVYGEDFELFGVVEVVPHGINRQMAITMPCRLTPEHARLVSSFWLSSQQARDLDTVRSVNYDVEDAWWFVIELNPELGEESVFSMLWSLDNALGTMCPEATYDPDNSEEKSEGLTV